MVSPDGSQTAWGDFGGDIQVWDHNRQMLLAHWKGSSLQIRSVVWSPEGNQLASVGMAHDLKVWDPSTGDLVRELYGGEIKLIRHDHRCAEGGHEPCIS